MKTIELKATAEKIDVKRNMIVYETGIEAGPGVIVLSDSTGERGMLITNQVHNGGPVTLTLKPFMTPAKKYSVGDVVGTLILIE